MVETLTFNRATIFGILGTFVGWVDDRIWLVQNGVVPSNPTKFTLNYIDWLNSANVNVKGFGCNYQTWTTLRPDAEIIIWTAILQARPKLYVSYTLTDIGNVGGWVSWTGGLSWHGHYTNVRNDAWVSTGITRDYTTTVDGGLWGRNELMFDFSEYLNNPNRANFTLDAVSFARHFEWSDGDKTKNIVCSLMQSNCNMWLSR